MKRHKMPSVKQIYEHWADSDQIHLCFDEGECFACGNYTLLQRAHILPVDSGGDHNLNNLHLLCHGCHVESEPYFGKLYWVWLHAMNDQANELHYLKARRQWRLVEAVKDMATPQQIERCNPAIIDEILHSEANLSGLAIDELTL